MLLVVFLALAAVSAALAVAQQSPEGAEASTAPQGSASAELPRLRTATSDTYALPSGERETRIYEGPINYKAEAGRWKPIDEGLEETASGALSNGEGAVDVSLPSDLQAGPVRLSVGDHWVASELLGTGTQTAELDNGTASYESPGSGASFNYSTVPNGVKEEIELAGPASSSSFHYELSASAGLTPKLVKDGSIEFEDGEGKPIVVLPAPTVADSSSTIAGPGQVGYSLSPRGEGTWDLTVEVNRSWLEDPSRAWPVRIDPTLLSAEASSNASCTLDSVYYTVSFCGLRWIYAIAEDEPTPPDRLDRAIINFNLSTIPAGADVREAAVNLYSPEAAQNTSGVELQALTSNWNSANATWEYRDKTNSLAWASWGGDFNNVEGPTVLTNERGSQSGWWSFSKGVAPIVENWLAGTTLKAGLLIRLKDEAQHECCVTRRVMFESSFALEPSKRPYLKVLYWPKAPASSQVVSPKEGTTTARRLNLKAAWTEAGVTGVTFQYREGKTGFFENIPPELMRKANGEALTKWPFAVSGVQETEPLYFDAAHVSPTLRKEGGSIQVRAVFDALGAGAEGYSAPVEAKVNRFLGGPKDATAQVGPGSVDLLTGNLTLSRTDVAIPGFTSSLEFSRTLNTRGLGAKGSAQESEENKSALGAGWKPGVPVEEAGGSEWRSVRTVKFTESIEGENFEFAYATLTSNEGYELSFEEEPSGAFVTPPELTGWKLVREIRESSTRLVLSDPAGNRTTFDNLGSGSEYVPTAISQVGGGGNTTRVEYELFEGKKRVHMVVAPTPAGASCTSQAEATGYAGCHALIFSYAPASTWGAPAADGERLSKITYYAPGNGGPWEVANYKYNAEGRLIEEWDPRISPALPEKYSYNSSAQLASLTPPGQKPWELEYTSFDEETGGGRLVVAKRASLLENPATAQTTIAYGVPISGSGAPYELGASSIAQWGQTDVPVDATAIFPPTEEPSSPPSAYTRASVYYMDAEGYAVNTATPKGGGTSEPSISTAEPDEYGNVVRELTPDNRLRVLAKPEAQRKSLWEALETKRHFNEQGTQMVEEWGPMRQVRIAETGEVAEARTHKVVEYDKNWPGTGVKPHLPTRETTGASNPSLWGIDKDQKVTEYQYDWNLRKPTEMIVDPSGLNIKSVTVYDETSGLPIETRQPNKAGEANTPGTTQILYYGMTPLSGENLEACQASKYVGLPCKVTPAAQTSGSGRPELLVKKFRAYNQLGEPTEVIASPGGGTESARKTITTYDAAGRQLTQKVEGGGTPIPKTETVYSNTLGLPEKQQFVCEGAECSEGGFSYSSSFGSSGTGSGQFAHPAGIAIDSSGNLWVADENNHRLEKFNAKGEFIKAVGSSGTGNGQFGRPTDVAIDAKGNIWATDASNNRIEEFNEAGEFLKAIGSAGTGNLQFSGPECIGVDAKGNIWVGDTYNARLQELNEKGEFIRTVSSRGSGEGQMIEPTGIAFGPGGNVWVADWGNQRIEEFSESGSFIRQFGSEGTGNGQFKRPDVIEVEAGGNVFVGDQNNERIQEFNQSGEFVAKFGTGGTGAGQFSFGWPMGIAADGKGTLWISDTGNNRVQKWTASSAFNKEATTVTYDALGRPTTYEDADGNKATTTYDVMGRPVTNSDAKGSQTYRYDSVTGLLTELVDSGAGTFTAKYDADGNLVERTLPDGLTAKTTYNEADEPTHLTYTKASNCGTSCTWFDEGLERSIYGQILNKAGSLSSEQYGYDKAGRLTLAKETPTGGTCTTRAYSYDADTNRTELATHPGVGGICSESGGTAQKYRYDEADRLEGPTYDAWGRITSLPAEFAGGKTLTTEYFSNEMVAMQSQNGVTNTFQLDASGRQRQRVQGGGLEGTEVFHYDAPGDSPAWTERGVTWTRNIAGIGGELCATQESGSGVKLLLTDLHATVVAMASPNPTETKLLSTYQFDEFGNPVSGNAGRYGWLGGKQRRTELASGVIQMGARSYVPAIGRFISTDPVRGGSANAYDYVDANPISGFDLTGERPGASDCYPGFAGCQCKLWTQMQKGKKRGTMQVTTVRKCNRFGGITLQGYAAQWSVKGPRSPDLHDISAPAPVYPSLQPTCTGLTAPCQNYQKSSTLFHCEPGKSYQLSITWGFVFNFRGEGAEHYLHVETQLECPL